VADEQLSKGKYPFSLNTLREFLYYRKTKETLSFLGEPRVKQKVHNNKLIFRFDSGLPQVTKN